MLLFVITCCFSFIFFYKPLPPWACDMRLLSFWFWKDFSYFPLNMSPKKKIFSPKVENVETTSDMSLLDLPELVLDSILEKLPPDGLCRMASVCVSLREKCVSDHLWEKHMNSKWSRIVGPTAYRKWQWDIAVLREGSIFYNKGKQEKGLMEYLTYLWPFILIGSSFSSISNSYKKKNNFEFPRGDSIMSWYLALESGEFWFPAQVCNRECGHVGFMLSCYDAELCYDSRTDTFEARYPPHGRRASATESGVTWDRLRASPIDTSPHELHISDCLNELKPGDHVEIQWRRNKEFPYGWWYGIVGHLGTCDGNANYCQCHHSDTVVLEFHQYAPGSRWRTTNFSRKHHREEGNVGDGFYGGIRKLSSNEEISMWKKLFPSQVLQ